ncbi:MAG: outer membrane beta-barrel domain-containing protein [Gammaproteobacteria bacterium]|nr:MAG: outer membrane beta-barrel domain-containing protein [Gammaproteobacteria bacterium]
MACRGQFFLLMKGYISTIVFLSLAMITSLAMADENGFSSTDEDQIIHPEENQYRPPKDARIDTENIEFGLYGGQLLIEDFGSSPVYGARLSYRANSVFFLESRYGRASAGTTSFERLSGNIRLLTAKEREFRYYDISLGADLFPGESFIYGRALNTAYYLIAGLGGTDFAGDTQFTVNYGAGWRILPTDWLELYIETRDQMMDRNILGQKQSTHNLSFTGGIAIFF